MSTWDSFSEAPLGVHIAYYIVVGVFFALMFACCILVGIYAKRLKTKRKAYLDTLDEHELAIVTKYRDMDVSFAELFKR